MTDEKELHEQQLTTERRRKIDDLDNENRRLRAERNRALGALDTLIKVALLLQSNAEWCVAKHHAHDLVTGEWPGWLADTKADIERARAAYNQLTIGEQER